MVSAIGRAVKFRVEWWVICPMLIWLEAHLPVGIQSLTQRIKHTYFYSPQIFFYIINQFAYILVLGFSCVYFECTKWCKRAK